MTLLYVQPTSVLCLSYIPATKPLCFSALGIKKSSDNWNHKKFRFLKEIQQMIAGWRHWLNKLHKQGNTCNIATFYTTIPTSHTTMANSVNTSCIQVCITYAMIDVRLLFTQLIRSCYLIYWEALILCSYICTTLVGCIYIKKCHALSTS